MARLAIAQGHLVAELNFVRLGSMDNGTLQRTQADQTDNEEQGPSQSTREGIEVHRKQKKGRHLYLVSVAQPSRLRVSAGVSPRWHPSSGTGTVPELAAETAALQAPSPSV
jgi:hypothetical protein